MLRKEAARYMGLSLRKFDEIKHLFRRGLIEGTLLRYDKVLIDRYIDLSDAA